MRSQVSDLDEHWSHRLARAPSFGGPEPVAALIIGFLAASLPNIHMPRRANVAIHAWCDNREPPAHPQERLCTSWGQLYQTHCTAESALTTITLRGGRHWLQVRERPSPVRARRKSFGSRLGSGRSPEGCSLRVDRSGLGNERKSMPTAPAFARQPGLMGPELAPVARVSVRIRGAERIAGEISREGRSLRIVGRSQVAPSVDLRVPKREPTRPSTVGPPAAHPNPQPDVGQRRPARLGRVLPHFAILGQSWPVWASSGRLWADLGNHGPSMASRLALLTLCRRIRGSQVGRILGMSCRHRLTQVRHRRIGQDIFRVPQRFVFFGCIERPCWCCASSLSGRVRRRASIAPANTGLLE